MVETIKQTATPEEDRIVINYPITISKEDFEELKGYSHSTLGDITEDNIEEALINLLDSKSTSHPNSKNLLGTVLTKAIIISDKLNLNPEIMLDTILIKASIISDTFDEFTFKELLSDNLFKGLFELEEKVISKWINNNSNYIKYHYLKSVDEDLSTTVTMKDLDNEDLFTFIDEIYLIINEENRKKLLQAVEKELGKPVNKYEILVYLDNYDYLATYDYNTIVNNRICSWVEEEPEDNLEDTR